MPTPSEIDPSEIERADRLSRNRARLFSVLGILLIVASALLTGLSPVGLIGHAAWVLLFLGGAALVALGSRRSISEDETTRANRQGAIVVGWYVAIALAITLYIIGMFRPLDPLQALRLMLIAAIAAPLINFGARERRDLGAA